MSTPLKSSKGYGTRFIVWCCSAILYQEQSRYDEAIDSYKMAIQCRPRLTSKKAFSHIPVVCQCNTCAIV